MSTATPLREPSTPSPGQDPAGPPPAPVPFPAGRYRLLEHLGEGGMGVVWKAWDTELDRLVALKQMKRRASPEGHARFLREARAMARLQAPGIVPIHDVGESAGAAYLAMAYIPGRTWEAVLRAARAAPGGGESGLRAHVETLAKVADAVQHAHAHGVVHRDLKPANVLLDEQGEPWVADFGLARELEPAGARGPATPLTLAGIAVGTPTYMSPEQACGEHDAVGPRSDVWALGVMLYEVLAGRTPFERETALDTMRAAVDAPLEPARRWNPDAPPDLERVLGKALAKSPADRYPSAGEFADDLRRWLAGRPVSADSVGRVRRMGRGLRRQRKAVAAAALAGLAVIALLAWGDRQREASRERARNLLAEIRRTVLQFQDEVLARELPDEARVALAEQPLGLVERRIAEEPAFGPGYSWRGEIRRLLGRNGDAEADFDRGCALSPESPVTWYLRGMARLLAYAASRRLPGATVLPGRLGLEAMPEETEAERKWRVGGLADLARMGACPPGDDALAGPDGRIGAAMAVLFSQAPDGPAEALRRIEGIDSPTARWLRANALYRQERFEEAEAAFGAVVQAWPRHADSWVYRALAAHAVGLSRANRREDPREAFRQAAADASQALAISGPRPFAFTARALAHAALAQESSLRGQDSLADCRSAVADLRAALAAGADRASTLSNLGSALMTLAEAQQARGLDPGDALREALAASDAALERAPEVGGMWHNRGTVRQQLAEQELARGADPREQVERALSDFTAALSRQPDLAAAFAGRGQTWRLLANFLDSRGQDPRDALRQSVEDFGKALEVGAHPGQAASERGSAHFAWAEAETARDVDRADLYRHAEEDFRLAIERGAPEAVLNLGVLHAAEGRWEDSVREFEAGIRLAPSFRAWAAPRLENARRMAAMRARNPDDGRWQEAMAAAQASRDGDLSAARARYEAGFGALKERLASFTRIELLRFFADRERSAALSAANLEFARVLALLAAGHRFPGDAPEPVPAGELELLLFLAFGHLGKSLDHGWADAERLRNDAAFESLHADPRWSALLARLGK